MATDKIRYLTFKYRQEETALGVKPAEVVEDFRTFPTTANLERLVSVLVDYQKEALTVLTGSHEPRAFLKFWS